MSDSRFNWPSSLHAAHDRPEFAPPPQPGLVRAFSLAVFAHLLLLLALTLGLQWKRDAQDMAAEAELWSSIPQAAAPKEVVPPPPPPPEPKPVVREQPKPDPVQRDADIALEREKKRKEADERERREALEREKQKKLEAQRKLEEQKQLEARRKQDELKKQEQTKLAAENRKKEEEKKRLEKKEQEEARLKQLRDENLRRIQGLANGTGSPNASGSAAQSSGPSASWEGRVRARVKPNIVFADDVSGNPTAEVEVKMAPDGTIVGKRLVKSSGAKAWDEAVLRALDKTEVLPRDTDGRVHTPVIISFRPKD